MASRTFANLGLRGGYSVGEDGWGDAATEDLRKLSILTQPVVFSFVTELPDSPVNGDRHILSAEDSNSGAANSIIYFDVDTWVYITPLEGWEVWDIGTSSKYRFNGAAWVAASASAVAATDVSYDAGDNGDSNSAETTVAGALDDLYERVRSAGGTPDASGIAYDAGDNGDSNSAETTVAGALDDLYERVRNSGGTPDATAVTYSSGDLGDSNSDDTTVAAALDELFSRLRVLDPAFFFVGGSGDANRRVTYVASRPFILPINLTGSQSWAETPTTDDSNSASVAFDIQKNGASIGTLTFDGGSQTGSFTFSSAVSFAAGDRLGIVAPASLGALLGISITLMGSRIG